MNLITKLEISQRENQKLKVNIVKENCHKT